MNKAFIPLEITKIVRKRKESRSLTGFTLIELLVVIGIILLLSAIALPQFRLGGKQFALQRSAYKLAQDIRMAQEMAMSAREFGEVIPAGYGIYLRQGDRNYLLYADINGDGKYDTGDGKVETIDLERGVVIQTISPFTSLSINFSPPDPRTKISGVGTSEASVAVITLALEVDLARTKMVEINRAGLIYVKR